MTLMPQWIKDRIHFSRSLDIRTSPVVSCTLPLNVGDDERIHLYHPLRKYESLVAAGNCDVSPDSGERWKLEEIFAAYQCDANVAARTADLALLMNLRTTSAITVVAKLNLTLTAGQFGSIIVSNLHPYAILNTNGTITYSAAGSNFVNTILDGTDLDTLRSYMSANGQVGDVSCITLYYRRVDA